MIILRMILYGMLGAVLSFAGITVKTPWYWLILLVVVFISLTYFFD